MKTPDNFNLNSGLEGKLEILNNKINEAKAFRDRLGKGMDEGIIDAVGLFNAIGFNTTLSGEGHVDRGNPGPYLHFKTENKPSEEFIGEVNKKAELFNKYNLNKESDQETRSKISDEYEEYLNSVNYARTPEFIAWKEGNEEIKNKLQILIDEFYVDKNISELTKVFVFKIGGAVRLDTVPKNSKDTKDLLVERQREFSDFVEFLKQKYLLGTF